MGYPSRPFFVRYIYDRHRSGPTPPPTVMSRGDASVVRCYAGNLTSGNVVYQRHTRLVTEIAETGTTGHGEREPEPEP